MLRQVADGVLIHQSEFMQSNSIVVQGRDGVLLIDPGVYEEELACLANDLSTAGHTVVAGFSTHPHWDHMLWHPALGTAPRYATARAATTAQQRLSGGVEAIAKAVGVPEQVPLELLGKISGLPHGAEEIPWNGPRVRIVEHQGHASGHAALLIEDCGVLVAGDMLSDVLVPILDLRGTVDPIQDYLGGLRLLEEMASNVEVLVPGHGSVGDAVELPARIELDRAYVEGLRDISASTDPRVGPTAKPGWEFVAGVHERQAQHLAPSTGTGTAG